MRPIPLMKGQESSQRNGQNGWACPQGIAVAVIFDAHLGQSVPYKERTLVKIMGTSTCDIMIAAYEVIGKKLIRVSAAR